MLVRSVAQVDSAVGRRSCYKSCEFGSHWRSIIIHGKSFHIFLNTIYFVTIGNDDVTIDKMFTSGAYVKAAMTCSRCLKSWTWDNHDDRVIYNCTLSGTILFTGQIPAKIHRLETNGCIISCIKTQNYFKWPNKIDFSTSTILEIIFTL